MAKFGLHQAAGVRPGLPAAVLGALGVGPLRRAGLDGPGRARGRRPGRGTRLELPAGREKTFFSSLSFRLFPIRFFETLAARRVHGCYRISYLNRSYQSKQIFSSSSTSVLLGKC